LLQGMRARRSFSAAVSSYMLLKLIPKPSSD